MSDVSEVFYNLIDVKWVGRIKTHLYDTAVYRQKNKRDVSASPANGIPEEQSEL